MAISLVAELMMVSVMVGLRVCWPAKTTRHGAVTIARQIGWKSDGNQINRSGSSGATIPREEILGEEHGVVTTGPIRELDMNRMTWSYH